MLCRQDICTSIKYFIVFCKQNQRIKTMKEATSVCIHRHAEVSKFLTLARVGKALRKLFFLFFVSLPAKYVIKYSSLNTRMTKSRRMTGGTYSTHGTDDKNILFYSESTERPLVAYAGRW